MDEQAATWGLAVKTTSYYGGKVTPKCLAAFDAWNQIPGWTIIEADLLMGACNFRMGVMGRRGTGAIIKTTLKDGMMDQYRALTRTMPQVNPRSGMSFAFTFVIDDNTVVAVQADTLDGTVESQKTMATDDKLKAAIGQYLPMLDKYEDAVFGETNDELDASIKKWEAMPMFEIFRPEHIQPQAVNY